MGLALFTGDDTGLTKRVGLVAQGHACGGVRRWGDQAPGAGVTAVSLRADGCVGVGSEDGAVRFWSEDPSTEGPVATFGSHASPSLGTTALCALPTRVVASDRAGAVRIWRWDDAALPDPPHQSFEMGGATTACTISTDASLIAGAGCNREITLFDLEAGSIVFTSKNVPHDNLDLPVPVRFSALKFRAQQPRQLFASTGFVDQRLRGEVRLYDASCKRRPVMRALAPLGEEALSVVESSTDGMSVFAGSVSGTLARLDVRMNLKVMGRLKGAAGSLRALSVHPSLPLLASASLDRHLRIYKLDGAVSRDTPPLCKVYLKQRLTALAFTASLPDTAPEHDDVDAMLGELPDADEEESRLARNEASSGDESEGDNGKIELDGDQDMGMITQGHLDGFQDRAEEDSSSDERSDTAPRQTSLERRERSDTAPKQGSIKRNTSSKKAAKPIKPKKSGVSKRKQP